MIRTKGLTQARRNNVVGAQKCRPRPLADLHRETNQTNVTTQRDPDRAPPCATMAPGFFAVCTDTIKDNRYDNTGCIEVIS